MPPVSWGGLHFSLPGSPHQCFLVKKGQSFSDLNPESEDPEAGARGLGE